MIGKIYAEIVNGKCPTCDEFTMLVGITNEYYRCMNCGADLQQHINGKITYLPTMATREDGKLYVKEWVDKQWPDKNLHTLSREINLKKDQGVTQNR